MNDIVSLPITSIRVLNPRERNKRVFQELVSSIRDLGLKKPITVSRRTEDPDCQEYDLVCGQGRLEAFKALGQTEIPAQVIAVSREERLLMSLVENLARRHPTTFEAIEQIVSMKKLGQTWEQIAANIGLGRSYIMGLAKLLEKGEERLIQAVQAKQLPLSVAVDIADVPDEQHQQLLQQAYESNELRGKAFQRARKILAQRSEVGKTLRSGRGTRGKRVHDPASLQKAILDHSERLELEVRKYRVTENRLIVLQKSFEQLLSDENFHNVLLAEGFADLPKSLQRREKP